MQKFEITPAVVSDKAFKFYSKSDVHLFTDGIRFYMGYGNATGKYDISELTCYINLQTLLQGLEMLADKEVKT